MRSGEVGAGKWPVGATAVLFQDPDQPPCPCSALLAPSALEAHMLPSALGACPHVTAQCQGRSERVPIILSQSHGSEGFATRQLSD